MPELIVQTGRHQGRKLVLPETEILIGRDEQCHIRLASSDVSREHCRLTPTPDGLVVADLGSRNGTFVNDVPVDKPTLLRPGDLLRVGNMVFQIPGAIPVSHDAEISHETLSDDDIASWLTDEGMTTADDVKPGDTTIISGVQAKDDDTATSPAPPPREPPRQFKSVAEEAADIIRRHWEMVRENEQDAS